jgi:hypothetical protein
VPQIGSAVPRQGRQLPVLISAGDAPEDNRSPYRVQRHAQHLHGLGERALHEFIVELIVRFGPEVEHRLEAYGRIDAGLLAAFGGDRFPPPPIREVSR